MREMFDVTVIGAGIVGLATARELNSRYPHLRIAVVEKEQGPGLHQSGHNSGVLHSGVYYRPGSLKARLCVAGKAMMERYAQEHSIPFETCGKLIVAVTPGELPRLDTLFERGQANGVPGLRMVSADEIREIEPHATGIRAVYSPGTGIIDFGAVTRALAAELAESGVELFYDWPVTSIGADADHKVLSSPAASIKTRAVISCAGLQSDRIAQLDSDPAVAIFPFRGDYYTLVPTARHLCRGLIYPVPDPALPFLGVHFTKRFDGEVWAGPYAVMAAQREGYRRLGIRWEDLVETVRYPGFRRLARRYWRVGAAEVWRDAIKGAFVRDLRRYIPEIRSDQLTFGPSGVRAQAVAPDGMLVDDFTFAGTANSLHLLNAPSPAATASLAIAGRLADQAQTLLGVRIPTGRCDRAATTAPLGDRQMPSLRAEGPSTTSFELDSSSEEAPQQHR